MTDVRMAALGRNLAEALTHYRKERDAPSQKAVADLHHDLCVELDAELAGQTPEPLSEPAALYRRGDPVVKDSGDYIYEGRIAFFGTKFSSGALCYVVENGDGLLLIMNEKQLKPGHFEVVVDTPKSPAGAEQTEKEHVTT
jgi:hypothetical protein